MTLAKSNTESKNQEGNIINHRSDNGPLAVMAFLLGA